MSIDRPAVGLTVLRICLGVFFLFEGINKVRWFVDATLLAERFTEWHRAAAAGSISGWYLERIAEPGLSSFAKLVPLGELACGVALIVGLWTPFVAFVAFFMAANFQIASGAIFKYSFLTSSVGLPVLGGTLALAIGGVRLKWSATGGKTVKLGMKN